MKYAIITDIHSNLEALEAILARIDQEEDMSGIFCLGDLVGYNTNPNECIEIIRQRQIPTIMGNHDAVACDMESLIWFNSVAREALIWTKKELTIENKEFLASLPQEQVVDSNILLVHGAPSSRDHYVTSWIDAMKEFPLLEKKDINICFFGHSHTPALFSLQGAEHNIRDHNLHRLDDFNRYLINPGALGQPRDLNPRAAFAILDTQKLTIEFVRLPYNILNCFEKIQKAGLNPFLGERLLKGL